MVTTQITTNLERVYGKTLEKAWVSPLSGGYTLFPEKAAHLIVELTGGSTSDSSIYMPSDARRYEVGLFGLVENSPDSVGYNLSVRPTTGSAFATVQPGYNALIFLTDNTTFAGTWRAIYRQNGPRAMRS